MLRGESYHRPAATVFGREFEKPFETLAVEGLNAGQVNGSLSRTILAAWRTHSTQNTVGEYLQILK